MSKLARLVAVLVASALGLGAAALAASGDKGVRACANKKTGKIHATKRNGDCLAADVTLTISGDAFKSARGGTITINGVAFKKGSGKTITINGTAFKSGPGNTITINGAEVGAGRIGPTGPPGIPGSPGNDGKIGPTGPPGIPYGPPPVENAAPVPGQSGTSVDLASLTFSNSDGLAHRVLVTGGFNTVCDPCASALTPGWTLGLPGSPPLVARKMVPVTQNEASGAEVAEIVVMPAVCGPCTLTLRLVVPSDSGAGGSSTVTATDRRLGIGDLGPVMPSG